MAGYNSISAQPAGHVTTAGEWTNMVKIQTNALEVYPVRKTADESLTSNTTAQADDELFVPVIANAVYEVSTRIFFEAATAGGLKIGFTFPTLATMTWGINAAAAGTAGATNQSSVAFGSATSGTSLFGTGGNGAGQQLLALLEGTLVTSSNAGTLAIVWSQNTSNAVATKVLTNCTLTATRIG